MSQETAAAEYEVYQLRRSPGVECDALREAEHNKRWQRMIDLHIVFVRAGKG